MEHNPTHTLKKHNTASIIMLVISTACPLWSPLGVVNELRIRMLKDKKKKKGRMDF